MNLWISQPLWLKIYLSLLIVVCPKCLKSPTKFVLLQFLRLFVFSTHTLRADAVNSILWRRIQAGGVWALNSLWRSWHGAATDLSTYLPTYPPYPSTPIHPPNPSHPFHPSIFPSTPSIPSIHPVIHISIIYLSTHLYVCLSVCLTDRQKDRPTESPLIWNQT